jgi:integrase
VKVGRRGALRWERAIWGAGDKLAPRTVLNVYSVVSALFRHAAIAGFVSGSPCILSRHQDLPKPRDKDRLWRAHNYYSREEVSLLCSPHPYIEVDSMVGCCILALSGIRLGELGRLQWKHYEETWYGASGSPTDSDGLPCLGRIILVDTKTQDDRYVPIHPALAPVVKAWFEWGWEKYFGRRPTPEDFVIPRVVGPRCQGSPSLIAPGSAKLIATSASSAWASSDMAT